MTTARIENLAKALRAAGMDVLALNPGPSLVYLTGLHFHMMERPVVMFFTADRPPTVVLPELEMLKVSDLSYEVKAFPYGEAPSTWKDVFHSAVRSLEMDGKRIGVEPRQMRLLEFRHVLEVAPSADFPDASDVVSSLRVHKDTNEAAAIRRAVQIAQSALEATLPLIRIGMTEREVASELVLRLFREGANSDMQFSPIVSSGPNGANPHAMPSDRKLRKGDLLVIDWGAAWNGYVSDLTRTFAVGEVEAEYRKIHQIVQEANATGRAVAKPGIPCGKVDIAVREVIEKAGYGEAFTHRTGHGIGMEGHEDPYIRCDNMQTLEPGMAFTIEPGIYLPGRNGVRIEDNVIITETGLDCLSDMPREMRTVE